MKRTLLSIGGVILLLALGYFILRETANNDGEMPGGETSEGLLAEPNALFAYDQPPGDRATASLVLLEDAGFVAIHADDGGAPGPIIGTSALLSPGEHRNVEVSLSREAKDGEIFHAMLRKDNGNGSFDASTDKPVQGSLGGVVTSRFEINPDAAPPEEAEL